MNMEQLLLADSEGQDLKRQRGRRSSREEGYERSLAHSYNNTAHMHVDKTLNRMDNGDGTKGTQY